VLFCFTGLASASNIDYSDAGYDEASHKGNHQWQYLGDNIDFEDNDNATDNYDDGVEYSLDGGLSYIDLVDSTQFFVGQTATFKFTMNKKRYGTHYADHIKSWVDWGGNGFNDAEVILYDYQVLEHRNDNPLAADPVESYDFESSTITFTDAHIGDSWLRARVACSSSLGYGLYTDNDSWDQTFDYGGKNWDPATTKELENAFKATGHLNQGEVEDYKFTVGPQTPTGSVPEPATMMLFGIGLLSLAGISRRKK
ncbi:MAG: PEP-CTERM sorting domain-containing protein, partial [Desulfobacteraceae bacterium]|nr:PEP-CTERM sorting domain-containing protein [Desulfobacteraceae bacterium]